MNKVTTHRILCPSPFIASALAEIITSEGGLAFTVRDAAGKPTVLAQCTTTTALQACQVIGG